MILLSDWSGKDLLGVWQVTKKLDGVRALSDGRNVLSKKGKPLYGMDHIASMFKDVEVFCGSFKNTMSAVRTIGGRRIKIEELYNLYPADYRICIGHVINPERGRILDIIHSVSKPGMCDGVVLRQGDIWIKCKPVITFDLIITGVQPGKGKYTGRMGALVTDRGKIGTGFNDQERYILNTSDVIGRTVEVSCLELTEDGKLRHPRFIRMRLDKD